jgi:hypothetical protein
MDLPGALSWFSGEPGHCRQHARYQAAGQGTGVTASGGPAASVSSTPPNSVISAWTCAGVGGVHPSKSGA